MAVRKTTLEIDDEKIARAQEILGTSGIKDTVDEAIARVLRVAAWRDLRSVMSGLDVEQVDRWDKE